MRKETKKILLEIPKEKYEKLCNDLIKSRVVRLQNGKVVPNMTGYIISKLEL